LRKKKVREKVSGRLGERINPKIRQEDGEGGFTTWIVRVICIICNWYRIVAEMLRRDNAKEDRKPQSQLRKKKGG